MLEHDIGKLGTITGLLKIFHPTGNWQRVLLQNNQFGGVYLYRELEIEIWRYKYQAINNFKNPRKTGRGPKKRTEIKELQKAE